MMPDCKALSDRVQLLATDLYVTYASPTYLSEVADELRRIADELEMQAGGGCGDIGG
jgi:hypothetical protein